MVVPPSMLMLLVHSLGNVEKTFKTNQGYNLIAPLRLYTNVPFTGVFSCAKCPCYKWHQFGGLHVTEESADVHLLTLVQIVSLTL